MIINMIPKEYHPKTIVDICAGSGNFIAAALEKWEVNAIGIDIQRSEHLKTKKCTFYTQDALDIIDLRKNVGHSKKKLILANPPFGKFEGNITSVCRKHTELQEVAIKSKRIETNMIVSNMSLLEDGEIFAAILPENIFSSEKLNYFKNIFLSYFEPIFIGEPSKYFPKSEVITRIFIAVYRSHNVSISSIRNMKDKGSFDFEIVRGIDNSKIHKGVSNFNNNLYRKIIHFNNSEGIMHSDCFVPEDVCNSKYKIAMNDLLICRVGRASGRVFLADKLYENQVFSDYFFVVKNLSITANKLIAKKLEKLLIEKRKGLTTKYINKRDINEALNRLIS